MMSVWRETETIDVGLPGGTLRGIAVDDAGRLYAVGDSDVRGPLGRWTVGGPAHAVAVAPDGRIWVGRYGRAEIFEPDGTPVGAHADTGRLGLVTAIGFAGSDVFLADASARWIRRYDRDGRWVNDIGDHHRKGGFHIPNGVVDFAVDADGLVWVANPGMHRVERYTPDGRPRGFFGRFDGVDPAGFPGCCNPTNLALDRDGRVLVTEKAPPRVKAYAPDGEFLGVVAEEGFDPGSKNMDVAVDPKGRVLVAETTRGTVRVFVETGP